VVYDANNGTREARNNLAKKFDDQGIHVIMLGIAFLHLITRLLILSLESMCDDPEVIERNIRSVKISSPDVSDTLIYPLHSDGALSTKLAPFRIYQYRGWDPDKAVQDYYLRIRDHEKYYEPVEETTWPFIRIINVRFTNVAVDILFSLIDVVRSPKKFLSMYASSIISVHLPDSFVCYQQIRGYLQANSI
jgi:6-phosphofructo-2-kinase / fructose-2,6-biphosphatase 4